ncbi:MAG: oligoendopeptidase F [Candidatus Promineifilaceae bacterium]
MSDFSPTEIPNREDVPVEFTWDATTIFPNDDAWEEAIRQIEAGLPSLTAFEGTLAQSPDQLLAFIKATENTFQLLMKVYMYASMFYQADTSNQEAAAMNGRAGMLFAQVAGAAAFGEPEMLAIGWDTLEEWMAGSEALALYRHYFERLYTRIGHVRSSEVEALLAQADDVFRTGSSTHSVLAQADLQFQPARNSAGIETAVSNGTISGLLGSADREVRRTAYESFTDSHLAVQNTMATALHAGVKRNVFMMRAHNYESSLQAALANTFIPETVYRRTLETFQKNLPTWHKYWRVRREALRLDTLAPYDIWAPLTTNQPHVSYEEAIEWISAGLAPLGDEYITVMRKGTLEDRWVDIYPNKGKSAGAFSAGAPGTNPFILMNYNNDVRSMSTLAHEIGHSMHSYFAWKTQPLAYANYGIFVAEVASNFNQALVRAHLLKNMSDPNFEIALIEEAMSNFYRYFCLMPTLARFELTIHEWVEQGKPLTAVSLNNLMTDLFAEAFGSEMTYNKDRVGITWATFHTHLYLNFYVYQYATGIAAAHALADNVLAGKDGAVDQYLDFLKTGSSRYPLDTLRLAGVDMTSPEPMEKAFAVLASYVDRLETLTKVTQAK